MTDKKNVMGVFAYMDDLISALQGLKEKGVSVHTVYTPTPRHEILQALGVKPSPVRYFTLAGGILGVLTGVGLVVYTSLQWNFIVGGKPIVPLVPSVVVGFEFCILLAILFNLAGMLINARMPKIRLPDHYEARFTQDRFGVLVTCAENDKEIAEKILREAGAEEVHDIQG
jgi:molybdopterin-containing oxidoreductase family membrane subunit